MDRAQLETLLRTKYGEEFDTSLITDEDIATLNPPEEDDEVNDVNDEQDEHVDNTDDDEVDVDLSTVDVDSLSEDGKLLYKMILKEKKARQTDKINAFISSSELSEVQKKAVKKYAKVTDNIDEIKEMIADLEKDNKASKRVIGTTRIIGKNNVKSTITKTKQDKTPSFGTKDFGAWLAKNK